MSMVISDSPRSSFSISADSAGVKTPKLSQKVSSERGVKLFDSLKEASILSISKGYKH